MKKFFAFLLAFSVCFLALGTYGFESPANCTGEDCKEHSHSGMTLLAADEDGKAVYLYADVESDYNESVQTMTVRITIDSDVAKIRGGSITISTSSRALKKPAISAFSQLFDESAKDYTTITSTASTTKVLISIPNSATDSRDADGYIVLTYPVDETYLDVSWAHVATLSITGAAYRVDASAFGFDSFSTNHTLYICNHDSAEWRVTDEATCTEPGSRELVCTVCGYVLKEEMILPTDHDYDYTHVTNYGGPAKQPTCTTPGYGGVKCKMCGTISYMSNIPALGHSWGDRYSIGGVYYQECTRCGEVQRADNQCPHDPDLYEQVMVIEASTCETHGSALFECPTCHETEVRELPYAHVFGNWSIVKAPTCTETGLKKHTCSVCGATETEVIEANGHDFGEWTVTKEPTCVSTGTRRRICSVCGETETQTIEVSGHSWGVWRTIREATCTTEGIQVQECTVCGETNTRALSKTGHTFGVWTMTTHPTCTATGTETHSCTVCGYSETRTAAIDPDAHVFGDWEVVSAKTCISDGVKERTCTLCGHVEKAEDPCSGHTFGEPVVDGKVTTKTCSVCGYSEATKTVSGGVEKTLTDVNGSLLVTGTLAGTKLDFGIGIMPIDRFEGYRDSIQQYFSGTVAMGYDLTFLSDGTDVAFADGMELTLKLDPSLEDYDVDFAIVSGGSISTLGDYSRKGRDITIDGADLAGADMIFVVRGEENSPNIVVPIIIAVCTLAIAGVAVYFIMSKNKNKGNSF